MRTTLSLDDDVAARLEQLRAAGGQPFKQVVNDVLRSGLAHFDDVRASGGGAPFTRAVSLGRPLIPDLDDVSEVLALLEEDIDR